MNVQSEELESLDVVAFDNGYFDPMVQATAMTLVMAEKDPPVFRDFLGIGRRDESAAKQQQPSSGFGKRSSSGFDEDGEAETSTRASSGTSGRFETCSAPGLMASPFSTPFPTSSDPGSEGWIRVKAGSLQHHGVKSAFYKPETENRRDAIKRRDSPAGRESLQERLQMSVEALESRPQKVARVESKDDKKAKVRSVGPTGDELRLSMQPPRAAPKGVMLHPTVSKPELSARVSKKPDRSQQTSMHSALPTPARLSHLGISSERVSAQLARESPGLPPTLAPPAADEGSRTGIKGSALAGLVSTAAPAQVVGASSGPNLTPRRPKVSTHGAVLDSVLPSRPQFPTPPSRQLTIFYGGQAHVFDDVPPDKATQIMQLAGSNGRSWSTTYSPRQNSSIANSASEGSLSATEREREKMNLSRGGSSTGNLALSSEVQTLLRGLAQGVGTGRSGQGQPLPDAVLPPTSGEMQQSSADRIAGNGCKRDSMHTRTLPRSAPCTEDNAKEALVRGALHWI